jgi:hypothetical protein
MTRRFQARAIGRDQDQRTRHHGQRHMETPHQQVEDMAASQRSSERSNLNLLTERRPDRVESCRGKFGWKADARGCLQQT